MKIVNISTIKTIERCFYTSLIPEPPKTPNKATFFVFSIIEKGEGDIDLYSKDGKEIKTVHISENSCVIIPPFATTYHRNFSKNVFLQRNIHVDEATFKACCNLVDPNLYQSILLKDFPTVLKLSSPTIIYVAELCSLIEGERKKLSDSIHKSAVTAVLNGYITSKVKNSTMPVWIRILLHNLNEIKFSTMSIEDMVKTTNYSHGYVNREFKRYLGMPLKQYVLKSKLDIASSMLVTTDLTTQEIVDKLNFSNVSNFINLFKERYQITPAKYRKNNSSNISQNYIQDWGVSVLDDRNTREW